MQLLFLSTAFDISQVWYNKKYFVPKHRAEKIYASVCSTFAMSIANVLLLVDLFGIQKNVMLAMLLLLC